MAGADYAYCEQCEKKAFYDADTEIGDVLVFHPGCLVEREASVKAAALREYADAGRHPWTVFLRADGSPVTVNDHLREVAARLEAGEQ